MGFLYRVDEMILGYIERVCHSVQRAISMTNFDMARYSALFAVMCNVVYYFFLSTTRSLAYLLGTLLFFTFLLCVVYRVERDTEGGANKGYVNRRRLSWQLMRTLYLLQVLSYLVIDVYGFLDVGTIRRLDKTLSLLGTALVFYLLSCTPLPPATSRLSEFFSKLMPAPLMEGRPNES